MNEFLISWAAPVAVALALFGLSYGVLQVRSHRGDYLMAKIWFGLGSLILITRFVYWGLTAERSIPLRAGVCVVVCGALIAVTVETFRSINHKRDRRLETDETRSLTEAKQWYETAAYDLTDRGPQAVAASEIKPGESIVQEAAAEPEPNLVYNGVKYLISHQDLMTSVLFEGRQTHRYIFDPDLVAITAEISNEFSAERRVVPVDGVTAQIFYKSDDGETIQVNRGAWLSRGNRVGLAVNSAANLIILAVPERDPLPLIFVKEYTGAVQTLDSITRPLPQDSYDIEARLISEAKGKVYLTCKFRLTIKRTPGEFDANLIHVQTDTSMPAPELKLIHKKLRDLTPEEVRARLLAFSEEGNRLYQRCLHGTNQIEGIDKEIEDWETRALKFLEENFDDRSLKATFIIDPKVPAQLRGRFARDNYLIGWVEIRLKKLNQIIEEQRYR